MLKLYAGRENIDKERFIYEHITGETLVIVPDQYTLVAEEQAMRYMKTDCLFNTEILSMNRLGLRVLTEKGEESVRMLDKYGRFMLLSRLIREHQEDFDIFRRSAGKITFTQMLNDFISEFKQQECSLDKVAEMLEGEDTDPLLRAKLAELKGVIEAYEDAISGKYTDSEDYISMYVGAIRESSLVRGKSIWIYGYDSITPKFTEAMLELAAASASVNFIVNRSDFELDEQMTAMLFRMGHERGIEVTCDEIGSEYELLKSETIRRIERDLWADGLNAGAKENRDFVPEDLKIVMAANPYYEAESAAAYIWHLVRDCGYRMSDIQVIANDEGSMHPIIKRTFEEYGLPVFMDSSRDITDTPAVGFIVNLLWFIVHGKSSQYLFAMMKTGLAGVSDAAIEDLENYVRNYHIRGTMWDRDFKYGEDSIGAEAFAELNELRSSLAEKVSGLEDICKTKGITVAEFVPAFRAYLEDVWQLGEAVEACAAEEDESGYHDEAQRNTQSYEQALELLDQVVEIIGDMPLDLAEFTELYVTGLTDIEVGVIPPTADGLSVGTMIRTRPRPIRAAVILGANEGTLPLSPSPEGLFSVDEKKYFIEKGFALGRLDDIKLNEEKAAMYRILSRPSDKLYISWSQTDSEGRDAAPSELIDELCALFPRIKSDGLISKDIVSAGWSEALIQTPRESMRHMIGNIRNASDPLTAALMKWYRVNSPEELDLMLRLAEEKNTPAPLGRNAAGRLYKRDGSLVLSASAISGYFDCPFKYYIDRGLRPREEREFTGDSRSIGDVYHECLMSVAHRIITDKSLLVRVMDDDDELERIISEELDRIATEYRGGLFVSTGNEEFRMSRIREIIAGAVRAMAAQLSAETVIDAKFEEGFGRHRTFEPIRIKVGDETVYVEGKIDRADIIDVDGDERIRIIDYKTGSDSLNLWKMRNGYKMQLMIYLISASEDGPEPAGMFYFNIKDPIESLDSHPERQSTLEAREPEDIYKLKGKFINEPGVLGAMPAAVLSSDRGGINRDAYEEVRKDVLDRITETADGILRGTIDISPLKENKKLACSYCGYKSICRRDGSYPGNSGRVLAPEPKEPKEQDAGKE